MKPLLILLPLILFGAGCANSVETQEQKQAPDRYEVFWDKCDDGTSVSGTRHYVDLLGVGKANDLLSATDLWTACRQQAKPCTYTYQETIISSNVVMALNANDKRLCRENLKTGKYEIVK